jgi:methylphosphonate synthase
MYHRSIANLSLEELSKRTSIQINKLKNFEDGSETPSFSELEKIAQSLTINIRDLLPNDKTEDKVIVKHHQDGKVWFYPENTKSYEFRELASTVALPFSKAFEIQVLDSDSANLDLKSGLHQYIYNIGEKSISLNWELDEMKYNETIHPGDSLYMKPFINHNFRGNGKLLNLRIGGKIVGDSQRELSIIGKKNSRRAISETMQWFDPQGKN